MTRRGEVGPRRTRNTDWFSTGWRWDAPARPRLTRGGTAWPWTLTYPDCTFAGAHPGRLFLAYALSGGLANRGRATPARAGDRSGPPTATPEPALQIIAAGQNLERGAVIPTEALIAIPWPTSIVPPSAITDPADVVGTRARYTIARGEPIFSTMIVESLLQLSPTGSDAAAQIPPGFVGISIPYNRANGVALGVKDGDHVNVIVSWAVVDIDQSFQTLLPNLSDGAVAAQPGWHAGAAAQRGGGGERRRRQSPVPLAGAKWASTPARISTCCLRKCSGRGW